MSHYKPYPAYKDSGGKWLGRFPSTWKLCSLKWIAQRFAGGTPDKSIEEYWEDGTIPWLASGEVNQRLITIPTTLITDSAYKNSSAKWIPTGALVMALAGQGKTRGTVAQLAIGSTCNQSMAAIVPTGVNARFLYWWLDSNYNNLRGLSGDDVRDGLNLEVLGNVECPLPDEKEQSFIATHLDRETTRIDALVNKKTRFMELLREKRQALITHAVTKGLDPSVKMKDSGVEWLGDVPEHWDVMPIKHIVATPITDGPHETPDFVDEGIPFVSAEAISEGFVNFEKIRGYIKKTDHENYSKKYSPRIGDIFMIKSGATTGVTAIVDTKVEFNIWSPLAVIRCGNRSEPHFILNFLRSICFQEAIALNWSFGTQQNIGMGVIGDLKVTVPPFAEQLEIAHKINTETSRLDTLIQKTQHSIDLLKERRAALITAAVTGQIDLRQAA
jgi:type I restriction enzyme S subunit